MVYMPEANGMGYGSFRSHRSETSEPILMKLETYNYRPRATHHARRHFDPTTWVVSANSQFTAVRFLSLTENLKTELH